MWWRVSAITWSSGPSRTIVQRSGRPAARSNGRLAASRTRRCASGSACPAGNAARSTSGTANPCAAAMRCVGTPRSTAKAVRSTSWRATTASSAPWKAATSKAPATRSATGTW